MKSRSNKRDEVWGSVVTKGCSIIEPSLKENLWNLEFQRGYKGAMFSEND
jgi:hypothetical protein